jgi:DNA replication factor GINS
LDTFFQTLRDIQKKERATGTLSEVDEGFYGDASKYLQKLLKIVNDNPLSLEAYQLRDAQRITSEICERREVKIITSAITNVQRSHNLFKGLDKDSQLYEEIPYNTTPEEEQLYREVVDKLISYREGLITNITPQKKQGNKIGFKPPKSDNEDVIGDNLNEIPRDVPDSAGNLMDMADISADDSIAEDIQVKNKPKKLDANQVAMMFGQAPDDVLLDEQNNPVKQKTTGSMTAPFEGPKVPEYDTVALQNDDTKKNDASENENISGDSSNDMVDNFIDKNSGSNENITSGDDNEESITKEAAVDENVDSSQENQQAEEDNSIVEDSLDSEELVEFLTVLPTDILDEDEKTYGPFNVNDVALLPKSIVRILKNNNVVNIIK